MERLVNYLENLTFSDSDIAYLRGLEVYPEGFLEYLQNFEFKATVRSAREGELVFANEPLIQVEGPFGTLSISRNSTVEYGQFPNVDRDKSSSNQICDRRRSALGIWD